MKVVDLCAATGLLSHAFELEGFDVVAGYELDADKAEAWGRNHPGGRSYAADVRELTADDLLQHGDPEELVVVGGIPCQDFSTANQYKTKNTELRDHVVGLLQQVQPAAYAIENVMAGWEGIPVARVKDCDVGGYTQRVRGFYVGPGFDVEQTHAKTANGRLDGAQLDKWRSWGDVVPDYTHALELSQIIGVKQDNRAKCRSSSDVFWSITSKLDTLFLHTSCRKKTRWGEVEDFARLQGFPEDWHFPAGMTKRRTAIGDAVPLAMGRAVARAVAAQVAAPAASWSEPPRITVEVGA